MSRAGSLGRNRAAWRGQPLAVLAMLLFGWIAARAAVWEMPFANRQVAAQPQLLAETRSQVSPNRALSSAMVATAAPRQMELAKPAPMPWPAVMPYTPPTEPLTAPPPAMTAPAPLTPQVAAGHQMLWLAAIAQLPLPAILFERSGDDQAAMASAPLPRRGASSKRWSGDSWLLLRRGEAVLASNGFAAPSYGASQIGAVIRYRLAPDNARKPSLYLRASAAVRAPHQVEVATGLSARPLARLPIIAMAELRASRNAGATMLRPAVALVSEFPPLELPLGLRAETYAQAGYVGGASASAFADGQLHLTRRLGRIGGMELRAGGGAWGGAQQGASRVDIGPTASLGLPIGPANARLSADWRFRIAGSAAPGTGPAMTLSAGF